MMNKYRLFGFILIHPFGYQTLIHINQKNCVRSMQKGIFSKEALTALASLADTFQVHTVVCIKISFDFAVL